MEEERPGPTGFPARTGTRSGQWRFLLLREPESAFPGRDREGTARSGHHRARASRCARPLQRRTPLHQSPSAPQDSVHHADQRRRKHPFAVSRARPGISRAIGRHPPGNLNGRRGRSSKPGADAEPRSRTRTPDLGMTAFTNVHAERCQSAGDCELGRLAALLLACAFGTVLSWYQWFALKKIGRRAILWIPASAFAAVAGTAIAWAMPSAWEHRSFYNGLLLATALTTWSLLTGAAMALLTHRSAPTTAPTPD